MLSLILAALINPPAPADGTYTYVMWMNGAQIGTSAVTVKHDPSGNVVLSENESGAMNGRSGGINDTLTLDSALSPIAYSSLASIADSRNMKTLVRFQDGRAIQTGDVNKTYDLAADAKHFVVLDFGPFTGYLAFPAQMRAWNDPPVLALMPIYAQGMPVSVDPSLQPDRPKSVPASDAQISIKSPVQITLWYDPKTLVVDELDVPVQGVIVTRKS